jgi:hypothetical protein
VRDGARDGARGSTRRGFLSGVLGLAGLGLGSGLAGCDLLGDDATEREPPPPGLVNLLGAAGVLADSYDATITAVPTLSERLAPIRDAHRAHVTALAQALGEAVPKPGASRATVPSDPALALAALLTAEQSARNDAVSECLEAPPRYAPLVGSIAAARACHVEALS